MPYVTALVDRVFFVRWPSGGPRPEHLNQIAEEMAKLRRSLGVRLAYVSIISPNADLPTAEERRALDEFARKVSEITSHSYIVIEGDGFKNAIQRSVIAALGRYWWRGEGGAATVLKTPLEAIYRIAADDPALDAERLLATARAKGIVE